MTNESITVLIDGAPTIVRAGTPQYHALRDALFREDWGAVASVVSRSGALQKWLGDKFVVVGDMITYEGVALPEALVQRIEAMASANEDPGPLFAFYERLHRNPSFRSRTQLFDFMQHAGIPIEPDGTFLAYKGIQHDYTDAHTGEIDNSPGARNVMPRNLISDDPNVACHYGFHVGSLSYASTFSQRTIICRVDPEHVVCVPNDYGSQKMRVCEYLVIGNHAGFDKDDEPLPSTTCEVDVDPADTDDEEWGGDVEGHAMAAPVVPAPVLAVTISTAKPAGPSAAKFNRMNPAKLMEQSIDDLRKYAGKHLKIVGASKLPGGKTKLVSKIIKVRARRKR